MIYNNYSVSPSWIWSDKITNERVAQVGYNHFISNKELRRTLSKALVALKLILALCLEHPKRDQNPKFTPLSETTSIPVCFIWEYPPGKTLKLENISCYQIKFIFIYFFGWEKEEEGGAVLAQVSSHWTEVPTTKDKNNQTTNYKQQDI